MNEHAQEEMHDLAAAYALDALDPAERRAFDEHLAGCERCRVEVAQLAGAAASLAYAAVGPAPPPELRDRILEATRGERAKVVPLRPRWSARWLAAAAAAAAVLAVGLGLWATLGTGGGDAGQRVALRGAEGALVVPESGRDASLIVRSLRPAPAGKTYEVWVIEDAQPKPAGLFARGGDEVVVTLTRRVPRGSTVAVTLERAGGVRKPRGPILFSAEVPA